MRSRIGFLTRLVGLKLAALFTFVALSLYTPATTVSLLNHANAASKLVAKGTENSLQSLGGMLGDASILMPRKGAVELLMVHYAGMDKVLLFIGLTICLYLAWLLVLAGARGALRRLDLFGNPRERADARVQTGPPR